MSDSPFVVNVKYNGCDVYVGRGSDWGNPFSASIHGRDNAIALYKEWLWERPELQERAKTELKGKVLGCHCAPKACHADVLAELAND
jgi:hypothetical protein